MGGKVPKKWAVNHQKMGCKLAKPSGKKVFLKNIFSPISWPVYSPFLVDLPPIFLKVGPKDWPFIFKLLSLIFGDLLQPIFWSVPKMGCKMGCKLAKRWGKKCFSKKLFRPTAWPVYSPFFGDLPPVF